VAISCELKLNVDVLITKMWEELNLIRIYLKKHGTPPDFVEALVVKKDSTLEDVCNRIHRNLASILKHAIVWGTSAKYNPQRVGLQHVVHDEDVIEIVKKVV
jgi:ribosome-interacting GTPase 1